MNFVVCIKPIPDPRLWEKITIDPRTKNIRREGLPLTLGPLDKNAIEEALKAKERKGGKVTAISMGPPGTEEILEWAIVLGCDEAVLLSDRAFAGADTLATAYTLAKGIEKIGGADIIFLGNESLDGGTGQVGPQLAEFLGIPHVTRVIKVEFIDDGRLKVRSSLEFGFVDMEVRIPVVLTVLREINEPRLPSIWGALWVQEREIKRFSAHDLRVDEDKVGLSGSPTRVSDVERVEMRRKGEMLRGRPEEVVKLLISKLKTEGVIQRG